MQEQKLLLQKVPLAHWQQKDLGGSELPQPSKAPGKPSQILLLGKDSLD